MSLSLKAGDNLQTFYPSEADGETIQTHSDELN